ncbi:MAG: M48 family metallopeptidase [Saezia sp.]
MILNLDNSSQASTVFFLLFITFTFGTLAVKSWLALRQIKHVQKYRNEVPADFADHISLSSHHLAADYTVAKQRFDILENIWGTVILLLWTVFGGLALLNKVILPLTDSELLYGIILIFAFAFINGLIGLPWGLWNTFKLEQQFGFNKMTPALWIKDLVQSTIVGLIIGTPLLALILWFMSATSSLWWLWAWIAFAAWQLLLMVLYPVVIAPMFNKFKPLEDQELLQRATRLMQRCGFQAKGFFVMDGSKRSSHSNAYFTGIGKSKRVVFYDTLLSKLSVDEIDAVLAHELGHFHYKHITKRIVKVMLLSLLTFAVLGWLSGQEWFYTALGVTMNTTHSSNALALLLFMLAAPVFMFIATPISARSSRKDEFEADSFACQQASGECLRSALLRLFEDNASTLTPDPVFASVYYSHPPAVERLAHLKASAQVTPS